MNRWYLAEIFTGFYYTILAEAFTQPFKSFNPLPQVYKKTAPSMRHGVGGAHMSEFGVEKFDPPTQSPDVKPIGHPWMN